MPGLGQKGEDALLHRARLIASDQVVEPLNERLDGRDDVPRQHLRQVVEEPPEKVVVDAPLAGSELVRDDPGYEGDEEQMPQDRGLWDTGGLGPSPLKSQLPHQRDEAPELGFCGAGQHLPRGRQLDAGDLLVNLPLTRSEERRVGKECRSRWSPYH